MIVTDHRHRTRVKICGITTEGDARLAAALGADALGFNTWKGGKRFIDLFRSPWLEHLPPFVSRVALLVNASIEEAMAAASLPFIDILQLHGNEDAGYCQALHTRGARFIKALRVSQQEDLEGLEAFGTSYFLVDANVPGQFGGTGEMADLDLAALFHHRYPSFHLLMAGGLNAKNVKGVVERVQPWAVDVSSGVESAPGVKDAAKMRNFIASVLASGRG